MSEIIIPSNPADLKKLRQGVEEIVNSMVRVDSEREYQKESIDELSEKFGIEKKHIRRMAVDHHKDSFDKKVGEFEDYTGLYESVMVINNEPVEDDDDDQ